MPKVAIIQKPTALLDKEKSLAIAIETVKEASEKGAELVVFTEAFIPGYPAWIWRLRPGGDWNASEELHRRLLKNAVTIDPDLQPLRDAARTHRVTVVCGLNERDGSHSRTTLYNTVVVAAFDMGEFELASAALTRLEEMDPPPPDVERLRQAFEQARSGAAGSGG